MTVSAINAAIFTTYAVQLDAIGTALSQGTEKLTDEQKASNEAGRKSVASAVRDFATVTAENGVDAGEARLVLQLYLSGNHHKTGTIKAYGNAYAGYRQLIEAGKDVTEVTTKQAQDAAASDAVKAKKLARDRIKAATKDWNAAKLVALADYVESLNPLPATLDATAQRQRDAAQQNSESGEPEAATMDAPALAAVG